MEEWVSLLSLQLVTVPDENTDIDLSTLQKTLDNAANDIVVSQRDGLIERKELASKTKEFRKLDEEGRANEWKGLLKCGFFSSSTASE